MSWLQDLAGKAENILTKIDKNAATVLQNQTRPSADSAADVEPLVEVTSVQSIPDRTEYRISATPPTKGLRLDRPASAGGIRTPSREGQSFSVKSAPSEDYEQNHSSRTSSVSSRREGTIIDLAETGTLVENDYSVEKELASTKMVLAEVKSERDDLKIELDSAQSLLSSTESEAKLKDLEDRHQSLLGERNGLYSKLMATEEANAKYIKSISELESIISKNSQSEHELNQKLEMARTETDNIATELQQYRIRAHATLQLKEKMITQLKENAAATGEADKDAGGSANSEQILLMELEQLKNDRSNLQEEIAVLNDKYEKGKAFWQSMEETLKGSVHVLENKVGDLQKKLNVELTKALQLDDDLNMKQKELLSAREELNKQRLAFSIKVHEKESEISKLKQKFHNRPSSPSSDFELRLNSLTQSLVQKQTTLESVTAERNALRLQLEKLDIQYRSTVTQIRQQRGPYLSSNETDDAKSQVPNFMVENPFDNHVARRVKRAYSSLDSIGIRLGVFLRRYPLVRILVIVYVAILHLWVMFVLLSSTPA